MTAPRFVDDYLGYLLGQANHAVFKAFEAAVREAGLSPLEWRVLAVLNDAPGLTVGEVAHEVLSLQPTVTKLLQRLMQAGWVALSDDPEDQRRTRVAITGAGRKVVRPLIQQARDHEAHSLAGLSPIEIKRLKATLRRLGSLDTET